MVGWNTSPNAQVSQRVSVCVAVVVVKGCGSERGEWERDVVINSQTLKCLNVTSHCVWLMLLLISLLLFVAR